MQYTYICFFFIQITDYKNINEIFSYALKQRWKYRRSTMTFQQACTALGPSISNACRCKETQHVHSRPHARSHTHTDQSFEHQGMRQQEAEIISSVLQRGVWCFFFSFFRLVFDFRHSSKSRILSFFFFSVSGLSVTYRQLNTQSTVRSGDGGTVLASATVTDPSIDLILVIVVSEDPRVGPFMV